VDGNSAKQFSFNGTAIVDSNGTDVTTAFSGGSLQAATQFIDTSTAGAASTTPGVGVIAKIQSQLSAFVGSLTSTSSSTSFASTYAAAVTASTATGATQAGQTVATSFFTVALGSGGQPDPSSFAINTTLPAGTAVLPQTGIQAIANSFTAVANYTASGLSAPSSTYAGLAASILSSFQQTANVINTQSTAATSQQTYYQQTLSNKTGVNTDTELANLVAYQNSYAASAHVISTVNQMLTTLMSTIG
jgi:flagellar hook-associated protein 1 FlgK